MAFAIMERENHLNDRDSVCRHGPLKHGVTHHWRAKKEKENKKRKEKEKEKQTTKGVYGLIIDGAAVHSFRAPFDSVVRYARPAHLTPTQSLAHDEDSATVPISPCKRTS